MELPLRAVRAIFSDIDGTLVHYAHVLERSGYCLNRADADKDGGLTEFIHKPTGATIPALKVPSTTLSGGYISKKTVDLVADLRARGVIFCLLTGARTRTFMKRHETQTIPFPDFGVCEGGGKIFTFNESTGAAELDEKWIEQFARIAGDWRQLDSDPLERQGLLWDCFREMHKAGYNLDAVSLSTGFYVDVRKVRKQKSDEDGQQAAASTEDSRDMFVSLETEEEAARGLFCGGEGNFSDRFGVGFVMNLGKGHVAPTGCNKRKAVEYIMQKTGVAASESVALFDDENDLEFAELCAAGVVPSIAHSSVTEALRTRLDPGSFLQPAVGGFLAIESGLEAILAIVKRQQQK
ncbi:hypothetical protein AK812_SmicGene41205 [Symbiodinium microadriaticum]|uniref:Uncharacterized protein n=1 Tax=Symbiodinium microadriaticum TaxID=2951 RepID=A0A1Q9C6Q8_SYMMI|nr:hypothetical protein AK812_SmicGene41205 [Symbiodinium microadriaticum]CAE7254839.1 unnamed protein product [Symbiodinium sp. KB8]